MSKAALRTMTKGEEIDIEMDLNNVIETLARYRDKYKDSWLTVEVDQYGGVEVFVKWQETGKANARWERDKVRMDRVKAAELSQLAALKKKKYEQ